MNRIFAAKTATDIAYRWCPTGPYSGRIGNRHDGNTVVPAKTATGSTCASSRAPHPLPGKNGNCRPVLPVSLRSVFRQYRQPPLRCATRGKHGSYVPLLGNRQAKLFSSNCGKNGNRRSSSLVTLRFLRIGASFFLQTFVPGDTIQCPHVCFPSVRLFPSS